MNLVQHKASSVSVGQFNHSTSKIKASCMVSNLVWGSFVLNSRTCLDWMIHRKCYNVAWEFLHAVTCIQLYRPDVPVFLTVLILPVCPACLTSLLFLWCVIRCGCGWLIGCTWSHHPPAVTMLINSCLNTWIFLTTITSLFRTLASH